MAKSRIMIVEDEGIVALNLQRRLHALGYDAYLIASSGEEAVDKAVETCPDLILMDIVLKGGIDGIQAAEQIRARLDAPVIYLTAYSDSATLLRAKISEPYGYVLKPFNERELQINIEMALYKSQAERRHQKLEQWFLATLRSIGDAVIATDIHGCVTFMNPVAEELTGWPFADAEGRQLHEVFRIINEQSRQTVENPVTKVLDTGRIVGLANHTLLVHRNGHERPIDDSAAPVRDDTGTLFGVVLVFRDVTERKAAETALADSRRQLSEIIGSAMDAIITIDSSQTVILFNGAAERMFGVSMQDAIGSPIDRFLPPRFRQAHRGHIERFGTTGVSKRHMNSLMAVYGLRANGEEFPMEASISQVEVNGQRLYTVIMRDISERIRAQEEIRRLNAELEKKVEERTRQLSDTLRDLESFSYSVSHDLKAPIRAISGYAEILMNDHGPGFSEDALGLLRAIIGNSQNLQSLIEDLLAFARVGRINIATIKVDMRPVVQEIAEDYRQSQPGRTLDIRIGELPPASVDPVLIRQVWINLISNAVKFTRHAPQAVIDIGAYHQDGEVVYYIKDNGAGFNPLYVEKLFGIFQRLHHTDQFEGTGIGLSIVQKVVLRHGGRIWAESSGEGKGAAFYFVLPQIPVVIPHSAAAIRS